MKNRYLLGAQHYALLLINVNLLMNLKLKNYCAVFITKFESYLLPWKGQSNILKLHNKYESLISNI